MPEMNRPTPFILYDSMDPVTWERPTAPTPNNTMSMPGPISHFSYNPWPDMPVQGPTAPTPKSTMDIMTQQGPEAPIS